VPLGEQFKRFYPGLKPSEAIVWRKYLVEHEGDFDLFEYNVRVGDGLRTPSRVLFDDPEMQRRVEEGARMLTQRKIDVLAYRPGELFIIEVEDRADSATLGQLLMYEQLLSKQRELTVPTTKMVVANRLGQDLLETFDSHGIEVWTP
jgi:hypothetical protein